MELLSVIINQTTATIFIALLTAFIGPIIVEYIKIKLFSKHMRDPLVDELEYSSIINDELSDIRETLSSDRCWIIMFHNGGHFLHTNRSMQKFSVMFESITPGVSSIGGIFTNVPVSLYTKSTQEHIINGHVYISDYDNPSVCTYGLKNIADATGTKSSYSVALFDIATKQCIGLLGVDYTDVNYLNQLQLDELNARAGKISGYLSIFIKIK